MTFLENFVNSMDIDFHGLTILIGLFVKEL